MPNQLMNEKAAAEFLGVTVKCLQNWRWRNVGPRWIKLGRLIRYDVEEVKAYLAKQTRGETH